MEESSAKVDSKLYFKVPNVKFGDLFDWSNPHEKCKTVGVCIPNVKHGERSKITNTGRAVKANEEEIALFRYGERVFAVKEKCPHAGAPLHLGDIEELPGNHLCVRCPWHRWRIDLLTGKVIRPLGQTRVTATYPVRVQADGSLSIGFDSFSPSFFSTDCDF